MRMKWRNWRVVYAALLATALTTLGLAGSASAKLVGDYTVFEQCPWTTAEVSKCIHSLTEGGEVVLGSKKVPIVNPTTLQGGVSIVTENEKGEAFSSFFAAKNGVTLSKTPQPVPGGLLGLVPPEKSPPIVKALVELAAENGLTGVNSTLELALPASKIRVNEFNLASMEGVAMELPVKAHLENPVLGNSCYVGSESSPMIWPLTSGETNPPEPNKPITGASGIIEFLDGGRILRLNGNELVENAWSAPSASGCGGWLSFLIDPIINAASGLPSKAGLNTAILKNTVNTATAFAVNKNDSENP